MPRLASPDYFEIAGVYMDAVDRKEWPTRAVSEHFGVSRTAAAKWVYRARARGFLDPAPGQRQAPVNPYGEKLRRFSAALDLPVETVHRALMQECDGDLRVVG